MGVTLKPDADRDRVARKVQRILREQNEESDRRSPEEEEPPLSERAADRKLRSDRWKDSRQVAQRARAERRADTLWAWLWLLALVVPAVGLWLVWRRRQRRTTFAWGNPHYSGTKVDHVGRLS